MILLKEKNDPCQFPSVSVHSFQTSSFAVKQCFMETPWPEAQIGAGCSHPGSPEVDIDGVPAFRKGPATEINYAFHTLKCCDFYIIGEMAVC